MKRFTEEAVMVNQGCGGNRCCQDICKIFRRPHVKHDEMQSCREPTGCRLTPIRSADRVSNCIAAFIQTHILTIKVEKRLPLLPKLNLKHTGRKIPDKLTFKG